MGRRLSPEHQLELDSLYRVLHVLGEVFNAMLPTTPGGGLSAALDRAYEARDLRGLRMARGDLLAMADAATPAQRRTIDAALRARAGTSLDELDQRRVQRIERIRARGKLTSE